MAGFDYDTTAQAMSDLESELEEVKQALAAENKDQIEEELGDLIFAAVNVARFSKLDTEETLTRATEKFIRRFAQVEQLAEREQVDIQTAPLSELDRLWKKAKQISH